MSVLVGFGDSLLGWRVLVGVGVVVYILFTILVCKLIRFEEK